MAGERNLLSRRKTLFDDIISGAEIGKKTHKKKKRAMRQRQANRTNKKCLYFGC